MIRKKELNLGVAGGCTPHLEQVVPLQISNIVLDVSDLKFWAKIIENSRVPAVLKLHRKNDFSGLFTPEISGFCPKWPFFGHNQGWQKIFKMA